MKTLSEVLQLATQYLEKQGVTRPRKNAQQILSFFLGLKPMELYMFFDRPVEEKELEPCRLALKRRSMGEPLDYILGKIGFYHTSIRVTPDVLIPRQETEIMLSSICQQIGQMSGKALDLCTGSGCLAIGLKKAIPTLDVTATDLSLAALKIAEDNGKANSLNIRWLHGDLTKPVGNEKFDLVLCNPPYIAESEYATLEKEVRLYEPKMALVSGSTGYEFFERLAHELPLILNNGAKIFFEIGFSQKTGILEIFSSHCWREVRVDKDWAGQDRFFSSIFLESE